MTNTNMPMTVDFVMAVETLTAELRMAVTDTSDYRARVDAIAAAARRCPDEGLAITALIIALAQGAAQPQLQAAE